MNDMSSVIVPKSDQINADDFIAGSQTFTIREVRITGGNEQPVSIFMEGMDKAYRPCKSMSRCLVHAWGPDAKAYVGRSLTLYRDPSVKWGGLEVGGIRISHMSHLEKEITLVLTASKTSRKPFVVKPLKVENAAPASARDLSIQKLQATLKSLNASGDSIKWDAPGMLIDYVNQLFDSETIKSRDDLTDEQLNVLAEDLDIRLGELRATKD